MKSLIFRNGVAVEFTDDSTIYELLTVVAKFEDIDPIRALMTIENLEGATFDGEKLTNIIPVEITVDAPSEEENITVHFINRDKTDVEILQETQAQQDDVINFLLMGE